MQPSSLRMELEGDLPDDVKAAIRKATDAVKDLEVQLREESCIVPVDVTLGGLRLVWARQGKDWRILAERSPGELAMLLELPVLARVEAYPQLEAFGAAVRKATMDKLRAAGLLDGDR